MNRAERARRLAEVEGHEPSTKSFPSKSHIPDWLREKILETCQGQPDEMLLAWLESHHVTVRDVERWHAESQASRRWQDPWEVRAAVASLAGHPMRQYLGGMLGGLVQRHAPQNVGYLPPEFGTAP